MEADEIARQWIGTPFAHRASVRGIGADCLGLVRGVWRERTGDEPCPIPAYPPQWHSYGRDLFDGLNAAFMQISLNDARSGDVVLFRFRNGGEPRQLAILSRRKFEATMIHAVGGRGVCETRLSKIWISRRVASYRFP